MITITRLLARQIATMLRHLFPNKSERSTLRPVRITAGPDGLCIEAHNSRFAFQYREPTPMPPASLTVAPEMFKELGGGKPTLVTLAAENDGPVIARWQDGAVPRSAEYDATTSCALEPVKLKLPDIWTDCPPEFLPALRDTAAVTDANPSRYALNCVQVDGKAGSLAATDGHQALLHSGFQFGFKDELLIPATGVFGCEELRGASGVRLGKTERHLVIMSGNWAIFAAIETGARFPKIRDVIPDRQQAKTTLALNAADCEFLADSLPRLPGDDNVNRPITVDLNGCVAIRAKGRDNDPATELVLRNTIRTGDEVCVNIDRQFLVRAVRLGFNQLLIHGPDKPLQCFDGRRTYFWMPLNGENPVRADAQTVVIESPMPNNSATAAQSSPPVRQRSSPSTTAIQEKASVPASKHTPANSSSVKPPVNGDGTAKPGAGPGPIEQVAALSELARELLSKSNNLLHTLKRQRKQHRLMQSTLQSLRQLQAAG